MASLLPLEEFRDCGIPNDDPLRWHYHPILGRFYRRRVDLAVALAGSGRRVLEIGYGSGTSFLELRGRFVEVHALDVHNYGAQIAGVFSRHGMSLRLVQGSVLALPYASGAFDAALAISILEHLHPEDQEPAMEEIQRVLRPRGAIVVGVPGVNFLMSVAFRLMGADISKLHFSAPQVVRQAAAKYFAVDRVISQPPGAPASLMTYQWFKGLKR